MRLALPRLLLATMFAAATALAAFAHPPARALGGGSILPPPPVDVVVTPNSPWQRGANAFVAQGASTGFDIFVAVEARSGMTVDALWAIFGGRWVFLVPAVPALDGDFEAAIPAMPGPGDAPSLLAAVAMLSPRATQSPQWVVSVYLAASVTPADMEAVGEMIRFYDPAAEMFVLETFPPILRALVATQFPAFCEAIIAQLTAQPYVTTASCDPAPPGPPPPYPVPPDGVATSPPGG